MRHLYLLLGSCVAGIGCSDAPSAADAGATYSTAAAPLRLPDTDDELPERLSDLGLYPHAPDLHSVARGAFGYEPRYPLWSNGSEKQRFVAVPSDEDGAPEPSRANFSVGTVFFKTFSFETEHGSEVRPVETRVMRLGREGWEYYRYLWNDDGTDAALLTTRASQLVSVFSDGREFEHEVPGELDCKTCHEAGESPVLGYRQIQLDDAPLGADADPLTEQVLGYALGNCSHCHNGTDTEAGALDLRPDAFLASTIGQFTQGTSSAYGLRIAPGRPDESILFLALSRDDEDEYVRPMPPLGVQRRDREAIELFREWIAGL